VSRRKTRIDRHVDALLEGSPLPSGQLDDPADADALRAAIELNASRPAADLPSDAFVAGLRRRLTDDERMPAPGVSRRALLAGAGAVAAGVVGVVADRTLLESHGGSPPSTELRPNRGSWVPVALVSDLGAGGARRFETSTAVGFVSSRNAKLVAVSGACTHQGCLLQGDDKAGRLDCPCHRTSFGYDGTLLFSQLSDKPAPLPQMPVRTNGDNVEVFLPTSQT
jgi:nitrite reductase/ring-hydroxylating ferredoxin subunit